MSLMIRRVIETRVVEPECFQVKFADSVKGKVRFAPSAYCGVLAKLRDPACPAESA